MIKFENSNDVAAATLALAKALQHASPGDLAAVRRMRIPLGAPLFWRMAARHEVIGRNPEAWMVIARILAHLTPTGDLSSRPPLHDPQRPLGTVLCDGGDRNWSSESPMLSEQRLARLLAARGKARQVALERAMRMLANRRPPGPLLNVPDIAWAILSPRNDRIARDYYGRLDRASRTANEKEAENA